MPRTPPVTLQWRKNNKTWSTKVKFFQKVIKGTLHETNLWVSRIHTNTAPWTKAPPETIIEIDERPKVKCPVTREHWNNVHPIIQKNNYHNYISDTCFCLDTTIKSDIPTVLPRLYMQSYKFRSKFEEAYCHKDCLRFAWTYLKALQNIAWWNI